MTYHILVRNRGVILSGKKGSGRNRVSNLVRNRVVTIVGQKRKKCAIVLHHNKLCKILKFIGCFFSTRNSTNTTNCPPYSML